MIETVVQEGYYENPRPEIARLVPSSAVVILDVGCGKGLLGTLLKAQTPGRKVFGIENVEAVAKEASRTLDGILVGNLETMAITFPAEFFDCMVFGDVLEHLVDPVAVLRKLSRHLKKEGTVVCSIPNIRHYTSFLKILSGWEYDDYGLFDRTHLRFFSLKTMKQMLRDGGYTVEYEQPRIIASKKMRLINTMCFGLFSDFLALQYLLRARLL